MQLRADVEDRAWLEELIYTLLEEKQHDYCYTFHNLEIVAARQPFAFSGPLPVPAAVFMDKTSPQLVLMLYWPIVSRLSADARIELLQHEAGHIIDGHFSSYGMMINERFGHQIANMAMDIYINDRVPHTCLDEEGLPGVYREKYGFPPNLGSFEYAQLLQKLKDNDKLPEAEQPPPVIIVADGDGSARGMSVNGQMMVMPADGAPEDPQAGTTGKPGDEFTGKGEIRMSEVLDVRTVDDATAADVKTREIIKSVASALKASKKEWGRGFGGADQAQFIEAAEREAEVPWHYYLRAMESRYRADRVTPTRRRPSRRHPLHQGRVRRYGLDVAFLVDTSGSMQAEQLRLIDAELQGLHARKAQITVYHCDAAVAKIEQYNPYEPLEQFHGRGGTEYSDALIKLREQWPPPGFLVVYTDGYGGIETYKRQIIEERGKAWWESYIEPRQTHSPDGVETLWVIPEGCMKPEDFQARIAPWGDVVTVPTDHGDVQE